MNMRRTVFISTIFLAALPAAAFNFNASLSLYGGAVMDSGDIIRTSGNLLLKANETIGRGEVKAGLDFYYTTIEDARPAYLIRELFYRRAFEFEEKFVREIELKAGFVRHTWGKSDELRVLDILNPQDLNFVLFDNIEDRKIGRFTLSAGVAFGQNSRFDLLFLPLTQPSKMDNYMLMPGAMQDTYTMARAGAINIDESLPEVQNLADASYGARLRSRVLGFDCDLYFFSGTWTQPEFAWSATNQVHRRYSRTMMAGADFERNVGSFVVRGEVAWFFSGRNFSMKTVPLMMDVGSGSGDGLLEKDYLQFVVGFDNRNFIVQGLYFNLQYSRNTVVDHDSRLLQGANEDIVTGRLSYGLFKDALTIKASAAWFVSRGVQVNPEVAVKLDAGTTLRLGAWLFDTDRDDYLLGTYGDLDFAYLVFDLNF